MPSSRKAGSTNSRERHFSPDVSMCNGDDSADDNDETYHSTSSSSRTTSQSARKRRRTGGLSPTSVHNAILCFLIPDNGRLLNRRLFLKWTGLGVYDFMTH